MLFLFIRLKYSKKLLHYEGYNDEYLKKWIFNLDLSWKIVCKLIENIEIVCANSIRDMLREYAVTEDSILSKDVYISSLGDPGKSGYIILYQLRHADIKMELKYINMHEIPNLPANSHVLFVDDLIGTGHQSVKYINNKMMLLLSGSQHFSILTLYATKDGLDYVKKNTSVENVIALNIIMPDKMIYSDESKVFNSNQKSKITVQNDLLKSDSSNFDLGLLFAFSYGVPNNSCKLIWKHDFVYTDKNKVSRKWNALLPRKY